MKFFLAFVVCVASSMAGNAQQSFGPYVKSWKDLQRVNSASNINLSVPEWYEIKDGNSLPDRGEKNLVLTIPEGTKIAVNKPRTLPSSPQIVLNESPLPQRSFQGLDDGNVRGISTIPPDTHGAVGETQVLSVTNSEVRVQDKNTGSTLNSIVRLSAFFSTVNFGGSAPSCFDPRALYDAVHRRFIIVAAVNSGSLTNSGFVMAVSERGTATGSWTFYGISGDAGKTTWFDFPYVGLNKDLIVVTGNMFTGTNQFSNTKVWAFKKINLYDGGAINFFTNSQEFFLPSTDGSSFCPTIDYDADIDRMYMIQTFNGNLNNSGFLRLSCIKGQPPGATIEFISLVQNPSLNWAASSGNGFATQQNDDRGIDAGNARMGNALLINGNLWCTHTVFLPATNPTFCGLAWYQIDTTGSVIQNGSLASNGVFRYYPTIAVNRAENVLIGYTISDATKYASSAYAFRTAFDGFGALRNEYIFQPGKDVYFKTFSGSVNRWGDYSNTVVDPVDQSLWTVQQFAEANTTGVSRWATQWAQVAPSTTLGPLPVSLLQWNAKLVATNEVQISWEVAQEQNLSGYEIWRSKNGAFFEQIGKLVARGQQQQQQYSFTDKTPLKGTSYYRLRMIDKDGSSQTSDIRSITNVSAFALLGLGQNPVRNLLTVRFYSPQSETVELQITNATGQTLLRRRNSVQEGYFQEQMNVESLPAGTYYLIATYSNGLRKSLPFIKQ